MTEHWLTVAAQRYVIAELLDLHTVRGPRDAFAVGATAIAAAAMVVGAVGWRYLDSPVAWAGLVLFVVLPASVAAITCRMRPRRYELWASYRGLSVRLLLTPDEQAYGGITRALIRAREAGAPPDDLIGRLQYPTPV